MESFSRFSELFYADPLMASEFYIKVKLYDEDEVTNVIDKVSRKEIMDFTKSRLEKIASDPKLTGARISAKAFMREVRDVFPKEFGVLYEKINPFERRTKNSLFS